MEATQQQRLFFNQADDGARRGCAHAMAENEWALHTPPRDGITALRFASDARTLLVASWDATLRLYDVHANSARTQLLQPSALLDCDFGGSTSAALSGGLDGSVRLHDLNAGSDRVLGKHDNAARCVRHCAAAGVVLSGSWDKSLKVWDVRAAEPCVGTYAQPDKVLAMCAGPPDAVSGTGAPLAIVCTAGRHVHIIDMRQPSEPMQRRESALKCQTRCVAQMGGGRGYAMGAVEGRVAVEFNDPAEAAQSQRYAFKCHRAADGTAYPVNAAAFHPAHGTLATGGADGLVNVWDVAHKKRVCQLRRYPTSVRAIAARPPAEAGAPSAQSRPRTAGGGARLLAGRGRAPRRRRIVHVGARRRARHAGRRDHHTPRRRRRRAAEGAAAAAGQGPDAVERVHGAGLDPRRGSPT